MFSSNINCLNDRHFEDLNRNRECGLWRVPWACLLIFTGNLGCLLSLFLGFTAIAEMKRLSDDPNLHDVYNFLNVVQAW